MTKPKFYVVTRGIDTRAKVLVLWLYPSEVAAGRERGEYALTVGPYTSMREAEIGANVLRAQLRKGAATFRVALREVKS